jgi:hypothetical protein
VTVGTLPPDVARAISELEAAFPGLVTVVAEDPTGGVVRIAGLELSARWSAPTGDLWFVVPFHYPDAAIYPYYVTGAKPAGGYVPALQPVSWRSMDATQVSLRHNAWEPAHDTAVGSVVLTQAWLRAT